MGMVEAKFDTLFIYVFIYGLFNDAVGGSNCIASNYTISKD